VQHVEYEKLSDKQLGESTSFIKKHVEAAGERQSSTQAYHRILELA